MFVNKSAVFLSLLIPIISAAFEHRFGTRESGDVQLGYGFLNVPLNPNGAAVLSFPQSRASNPHPNSKITYIVADFDKQITNAIVTNGGIGYSYVDVTVWAEAGKSINFYYEVYGYEESPSSGKDILVVDGRALAAAFLISCYIVFYNH